MSYLPPLPWSKSVFFSAVPLPTSSTNSKSPPTPWTKSAKSCSSCPIGYTSSIRESEETTRMSTWSWSLSDRKLSTLPPHSTKCWLDRKWDRRSASSGCWTMRSRRQSREFGTSTYQPAVISPWLWLWTGRHSAMQGISLDRTDTYRNPNLSVKVPNSLTNPPWQLDCHRPTCSSRNSGSPSQKSSPQTPRFFRSTWMIKLWEEPRDWSF